MFPIGDDNSEITITPFVNYAFIGLNVLVFVLLQQLGSNEAFDYAYSLVPKEITTGVDITGSQIIRDSLGNTGEVRHYETPLPVYFNFLSSMFMHGGIMHIFGNMLFLWIFGDNLENLLGHIRFAVFYLACGIAAATAQIIMGPDSIIPHARSIRSDLGRARRLHFVVSTAAGACAHLQFSDDRAGVRRDRHLDRLPIDRRIPDTSRNRRRGLCRSHRRFYRGGCADQSLRTRTKDLGFIWFTPILVFERS